MELMVVCRCSKSVGKVFLGWNDLKSRFYGKRYNAPYVLPPQMWPEFELANDTLSIF
jgi:hypothetical protein